VRTNGLNSGSLTSVSYGFQLTIKGGLTGKDSVYMDISVSLSAPVEKPNGDYDVKTQTINTAVFCKLDETVAIGGLRELIRGTSGPTGLPYLRHVPLLNWFFAIQSDNIYDKQSLVLISPRLMSQAKPIEIPPSQELRDTEEEVNIQYREGKKAERRWFEYLRW